MSTKQLAERMAKFEESATFKINMRLDELKAQGVDIIALNIGEPDFTSPDYIRVAGVKAITDGFTKYAESNGISELRNAIVKKLKEDNNIEYAPNEICVCNGAKQAISSSVLALCGYGDEVIIPTPCWVSYADIVKLAGATPVLVPSKADYSLDLDAIEAAINPKTRAIIICTPNNPSGAVYSEESLRKLGDIIVKYDIFAIVDEIYEKLIYDGRKHFSLASISREVWERTVTVNGFSKAYAMTGWRLGYMAARRDITKAVLKLQSQLTSSICSIAQKAGYGALVGPQDDMEKMVHIFDERRKYVYERLCAMPDITCTKPYGAFYMLVDVEKYFGKRYGEKVIENASDLTEYLMEEAKVSVVPGDAYHIPGKIRISYSNSMENLEAGMDGIETALLKLM